MKKSIVICLVLMLPLCSFAKRKSKVKTKVKLETKADSISYVVGLRIGESMDLIATQMDEKALYAAIASKLRKEEEISISTSESDKLFFEFRELLKVAHEEEKNRIIEENKAKGESFLEANATKPGIKVTESGLQYEIITHGNGDKPNANDIVKCHYIGTHLDGKEFDNSYERGKANSFSVNQVIKGWKEVLQLMPVGSKWRVFIPSKLAYGEAGSASIGPNETLIFTIELIDIE